MKQNILEIIVGFLVLAIAVFFLLYTYNSQKTDIKEEYRLHATFENVDGIIVGSDVNIGGIAIGKVEKLTLDQNTYNALMILSIDKKVKLPTDSRASIVSSGFLGGKFVSITPGGDDAFLENNGQIKYTQSSINLESLIGKFMYSSSSGGKNASSAAETAPAPPAPAVEIPAPNN